MPFHARIIAITLGIGSPALSVVGCGEQTGGISGKATYNGVPVVVGSIGFIMRSNSNIAQEAKLDSGGVYTMAVPMPPGNYQVYYVPPLPSPPGSLKAGGDAPIVKSVVPEKYHAVESSELSFEVKEGKNDIPIEFKD